MLPNRSFELDPSLHTQSIWREAMRLDLPAGFWSELVLSVPEGMGLLCRLSGAEGQPGECFVGQDFVSPPEALRSIPAREARRLSVSRVPSSPARVFRLGEHLLRVGATMLTRIADPVGPKPCIELWFEHNTISALRCRIFAHRLAQALPVAAAPGGSRQRM